MRYFALIAVVVTALPLLTAVTRAADPEQKELTEDQKIDSLITAVEKLKDARFIRNGKEYDCAAAADHMRRKRKVAGDKVKTARDFIAGIASKSSRSGKPYMIKFKDGKEMTSEAFLTKELEKLEGKSKEEK